MAYLCLTGFARSLDGQWPNYFRVANLEFSIYLVLFWWGFERKDSIHSSSYVPLWGEFVCFTAFNYITSLPFFHLCLVLLGHLRYRLWVYHLLMLPSAWLSTSICYGGWGVSIFLWWSLSPLLSCSGIWFKSELAFFLPQFNSCSLSWFKFKFCIGEARGREASDQFDFSGDSFPCCSN